jgi:hypothetical protein
MKRLMSGANAKEVAKELGISEDLAKYNCIPSYMECLDENSTFFTGGTSKLTKIVSHFLPVV